MDRYYLAPVVGDGFSVVTAKSVKYFSDLRTAQNPAVDGMQFLILHVNRVSLVHCPNMTQTVHDQLTAQPDVIAFPETLTNTVGGQLANITSTLESIYMPNNFIGASTTYQQIIDYFVSYMQLANPVIDWLRLEIVQYIYQSGTTLSQLPGDITSRMQAIAANRGYDTTGLSGASTIREMLEHFSEQ